MLCSFTRSEIKSVHLVGFAARNLRPMSESKSVAAPHNANGSGAQVQLAESKSAEQPPGLPRKVTFVPIERAPSNPSETSLKLDPLQADLVKAATAKLTAARQAQGDSKSNVAGMRKPDKADESSKLGALAFASIVAERLFLGRPFAVLCVLLFALNLFLFIYAAVEYDLFSSADRCARGASSLAHAQ